MDSTTQIKTAFSTLFETSMLNAMMKPRVVKVTNSYHHSSDL